ncbi:MAG: DUF3054 domain-containing protein [Agrococcus casei]|uniref:PROBABLE CONSERVED TRANSMEMBRANE PROTEIN n=1 Tax=Agrococcus casei LMG 22410 TaxID=1255656 RepID=A0A1R4GD20_9MICO|nr:DUF3054 domain-containing protein [Agrococcus casei]SJM66070.1 PROBABLE CONSERVED TRANSMEMBRANE PROTEIN [Agrococcus casei LMG 22410]
MSDTEPAAPRAHVALALVLDAALVVVFAAIGRASHERGVFGDGGLGLATTAWPFLAALAVGWVICLGWRRPLSIVRTAMPVWVVTVAGGMLLRAVSDQGTALPFVIVATVTLLVLLVGWRLIAAVVRRMRARPTAQR